MKTLTSRPWAGGAFHLILPEQNPAMVALIALALRHAGLLESFTLTRVDRKLTLKFKTLQTRELAIFELGQVCERQREAGKPEPFEFWPTNDARTRRPMR